MSKNKVILIGNVTSDFKIREVGNDKRVVSGTLAVPRERDREKADFVRFEAWNKQAENLATYVGKGSRILIEGSLRIDNFQKDGVKNSIMKVVVEKVEFLSLKKPGSETNNN